MSQRILATLVLSLSLLTLAFTQTPQVLHITFAQEIEDAQNSSTPFAITATYDQEMNTAVDPVFSFPTAGENPVTAGLLIPSTAAWTDAFTFTQYYDVVNQDTINIVLSPVDVQVSGGISTAGAGAAAASRMEANLFCASSGFLPKPQIMDIKFDHLSSKAILRFDLATDYGGLSGTSWSQGDSLLYFQFPDLGDLSNYFDFQYTWTNRNRMEIQAIGQQWPADFRNVHVFFKWMIGRKDESAACRMLYYWNGDNFNMDYVAPYVTSLTTNLNTITESSVGTGTFQIVAQYNESITGNVTFSFPTLGEDPSNTLTLLNTVTSDNDTKVTATYSVSSTSEFVPDIDVQVSGAINSPDYAPLNEVQPDTIFHDVFSVKTCAHSVAPGIGKIPDLGVVCIGETLTVFTAPGRDGAGTCEDQYRYSTDDGATWSAWLATVPSFTAVHGKNKVQSRRYCDGNCSSEINELTWQASDDDAPVIICPANQILMAGVNCSSVLGHWNAASAIDNCGTVIVSQSLDSTTVVSGIGSTETITLTADDTHGHTVTCSFTVTLQDMTAPTVVCKDTTVYLNASNSASISTSDIYQNGSDNCGTVNLISVAPNTFNCSNLGSNSVVLTVDDGQGNQNTCIATVTVQDTVPPTISCKNPAFQLNAGETITITSVDVYNGGTDNCGAVTPVSVVPNTFTSADLGLNTVVFTATDVNGNTASCNSTVTILNTGSSSVQVLGITASHDVVEDPIVGSGTFSITVTYDQAMNTSVYPTISFPTPGENATGVGMLVPATAIWEDDHTFTQYYDVIDLNQVLPRVDVQVSGGADPSWQTGPTRLETDLFCASTGLAVPKIVSIITYHNFHTIYITFDQSTDFGGLGTGSWTQADSTLYLQFPQLGDISDYADFRYQWITRYILKVTPIAQQQTPDFRDIQAYFRWRIARKDNANACRLDHYWNGDNFDLDFTPPYVTSLTTNLSTITDADTGTGTFQIIAQYNENVGGNVQFSFPTLNENPLNTITLISTVKSDNDSKVTATYSVANVSEFIPDIDIKVSGATNEPYSNSLHELQADTVFTDVFSINTCTASTAPAIVRSPDTNVTCPGESLTITTTPGSGGTGTCTDEYSYSTDNGITWSVWSPTIPAFAGVVGTNAVKSRRACDSSCASDTSIVYWTVEDTTTPTVVCKNTTVALDALGLASITTTDVFQSATDNCGIINQVSVLPNVFDCSNLGNNAVTLTVNDGHGNTSTCTAFVTVTGSSTSTILGITVSGDIQQSTVGSGTFSITAVYAQAMNIASTPVFSFPNANEDPLGAGMLVLASGSWTDAFTFTQYYDVIDLDQVLSRVDVQVCGGVDLSGNMAAARVETDLFCANTTDFPVPGIVDILFDHSIHTAFLRWNQATDYGGLSGLTWTQTDSLLYFQFPGIGDITPYFDLQYSWLSRTLLKINFLPKQQLPDFRDVAVYFKWPIARRDDTNICEMYHTWNGQGFDIDYIAPYVTSLTTNLTNITDANTGAGTFQITAQYNEDFAGNVVFSFPTLNEDPSSVLTLVSTVKTGSQVVATYDVANVGAFIPDIDIQVAGAINNPVINSLQEVQADTVFPNVFSINTCTPSLPPAIVRSPDSNVVCPAETLTITLTAGSGGTGTCTDEYRYSTDNEVTWSDWSTDLPVFTAMTGINTVQSRRVCNGSCVSETNVINWTVEDVTPPTVICQNVIIDLDGNGSASISTTDVFQSATDNCSTINQVSVSPNTFDCSNLGDNSVTLTINDGHGNTADCTATVTVNDNAAPTVFCQNITVNLDANGSASITTTHVFQSATDNCGTINQVSVSPNTFDCSNLGTNTVTLTINDGHGNTADCTATVTVNDNAAPTVVCQNITVNLDANGNASITTTEVFQSATDNCGTINQFSVSPNTFDCSNLGDNTVTLTVNDGHGHTADCTATVTVNDNAAPTVICQNITIDLDANGNASISTNDVFQSATDNCGTINQVSVSPNTFDCTNVGDNTVTLNINDDHGNTADCTATVTVNDNAAPTVICQNITIDLDANGSASITTTDVFQSATDNCGTINQVSISPNTFDCSNLGDNTVTLTINDGHGNTADCTAMVTINDNSVPIIVCQNISVNIDANGNASIFTSDVFQSGTDNCGTINQVSVSPNTFDCSNLGDLTVTLTINDGHGNTADCNTTVTVTDNAAPTVVCQDVTIDLDANGAASISTNDVFQSATDNCGTINQVSISPDVFDCSNLGDNTVTLTINDGHGNTADCTATVTVNDNSVPTVICQNTTINLDANGSASISTSDVFQSATDNCGTINQVSVLPNVFDCSNLGMNTVTLTINDGHGNTADCTATVTVNDNTAPTVVCQHITIDLDANGSAIISTTDVFQSAADNCGTINQVSVLPNLFDCNNLGDNTVTLTINDGHGNTADCTATVTISDDINPCLPLPVELINFNAFAEKDAIQLHWKTTSEHNNAGFQVERSENGWIFKEIAFVRGAGTTAEPQIYQLEDKEVRAGQSYFYRLKQVNTNGSFEYSDIVQAMLPGGKLAIDIFPNPVSPNSTVQINLRLPQESEAVFTLFDMRGITLRTERHLLVAGAQVLQMQVPDLAAGTYFIKADVNGESVYQKLIVSW